MVKIGMPVKVVKPYKSGEKQTVKLRTKDATIVGIYKNFILVQFKGGYKECYKEKDLWYEHQEGEEYHGYKSKNSI